jgi:hypothetical protein
MMLEGTVINGTIVLDGGEQLPEGARVEVALKEQKLGADEDIQRRSTAASPLGEALMKMAGTLSDLPADFAAEHDHYIHGTPKRNLKEKGEADVT